MKKIKSSRGAGSLYYSAHPSVMRYTALIYFYMDCQSKVGLNVAICIAAYYGEKKLLKGAQMAR